MGEQVELERPSAASNTPAIQDVQEPAQPSQEEQEVADSGDVDPWPDEKPGISPEEEEALLRVIESLC